MAIKFLNDIESSGEVQGTSLDINGNADIAGNLSLSGDTRILNLAAGSTTNSQSRLIIGEQGLYGLSFRWDTSASVQFDGFWASDVTGTSNKDLGSVDVANRIWYLKNNVVVAGELEAATLDINGNADISGNLTGVDTLTATTADLTGNLNFSNTARIKTSGSNKVMYIQNDISGTSYLRLGTGSADLRVEVIGTLSSTGVITGPSLDINGNADISGNLTGLDNVTSDSYYINDTNTRLHEGTGNALRISTSTGYIDIGSMNSGWIHFQGNKPYYFNQPLSMDADLKPYSTSGARNLGTTSYVWNHVYAKGYFIDSTEVIDASRNLASIGTIGSGAITSTGKITGTELEGTSLDINGSGDISGNLTVSGSTFGLYHETTEDGYYHDSYAGAKSLSLFLKNQRADILRYRDVDNYEYWNGSAWVADSSREANVKNLLDGRQDTSFNVPARDYKFRFTTSVSSSWPTRANIGIQTGWSGSTFEGCQMLVEQYISSSWVVKATMEFGGSGTSNNSNDNSVDNWGLMFKADGALHTGQGHSANTTRITIDFYGWSPSNSSYTTIPLQNIFITSNYAGTENTDYTNLLDHGRNVTIAGNLVMSAGKTVDGVDVSALPTSFLALGTTSTTALAGNTSIPSISGLLPLAGGTMSGAIAMGDNDITGIDELIFSSGTKLGDAGGSNYVLLTYANSGAGGIQVFDGDGSRQGYLYGDGGVNASFGLLDGQGSWAVRCYENEYVELRYDDSTKLRTSTSGITVTGAVAATTFSGDLNGTINTATTAATQSAGNNSTKVATTAYADAAVAALIDNAPANLNTLNELAEALNDDDDAIVTINTALGTKLPLAGGTMTGDLTARDITAGSHTRNAQTTLSILADAQQNSVLKFREDNDNYGFTFGYYGSPNNFVITRNDNSSTGVTVMTIGRGSNNVTFTGEVIAASLDISGNADIDGTLNADGLDIDGNADISGALTVGYTIASNKYSVVTVQGRESHMFAFSGLADHTLTLNSSSYFQAEVIITAHQTNGGDYNNLYVRGIWSNNHTSHHWDEIENIGGLSNSTFTITNGQNGSTAASGQLAIAHDYVSGSFSNMTVNVIKHFGTLTHVIS